MNSPQVKKEGVVEVLEVSVVSRPKLRTLTGLSKGKVRDRAVDYASSLEVDKGDRAASRFSEAPSHVSLSGSPCGAVNHSRAVLSRAPFAAAVLSTYERKPNLSVTFSG
jgi:hypothetical protein